jgi:hypothetical protein
MVNAHGKEPLRPPKICCRHRITNSRKTFLKAARLSFLKSAMVLKSGFKPPNNQTTSMLRWGLGFQPPAREYRMKIPPNSTLLMIGDSITDCDRAQIKSL